MAVDLAPLRLQIQLRAIKRGRRQRFTPRPSYPAYAGYPVRHGFSVLSLTPRNTGSPAFAGDDNGRYTFAVSRQLCPSLGRLVPPSPIRGRRECRAPDAPAAACAGGRKHKAHALVSSHRNHPAFPAQWFTAYFALSPVIGLLTPSPLRSLLLKNLTPAPRRQDHTTSPSANALRKSHATVLVPVRRSFSEGGSAPLVLRRCRVHRIPCPTSVTIAIRPSGGPEQRRNSHRSRTDESGIFLRLRTGQPKSD